MNEAMRRLEGLVGEWDVTMTHAWFLDSLDTEIHGCTGRADEAPKEDTDGRRHHPRERHGVL